MRLLGALLLPGLCLAQARPEFPAEPVGGALVLAASPRDYLLGAGGTLARMAAEGVPVTVVVFGDGAAEASAGMAPEEARQLWRAQGEEAGRRLGVRETIWLGHPGGTLGRVSSSELRNQAIALTRYFRPEYLFFPDWYVHYIVDDDVYRVGRMAEESPYGGGDLFLQEMTYFGLRGYAAREYFFYSAERPYREREGGEGRATMRAVDIGGSLAAKLHALEALETANANVASRARARASLEAAPSELARAFAEDLAAAVGRRYGFPAAEEFNHLGRGGGVPEHVRERARPAR